MPHSAALLRGTVSRHRCCLGVSSHGNHLQLIHHSSCCRHTDLSHHKTTGSFRMSSLRYGSRRAVTHPHHHHQLLQCSGTPHTASIGVHSIIPASLAGCMPRARANTAFFKIPVPKSTRRQAKGPDPMPTTAIACDALFPRAGSYMCAVCLLAVAIQSTGLRLKA